MLKNTFKMDYINKTKPTIKYLNFQIEHKFYLENRFSFDYFQQHTVFFLQSKVSTFSISQHKHIFSLFSCLSSKRLCSAENG